jgi:hypothetical protein
VKRGSLEKSFQLHTTMAKAVIKLSIFVSSPSDLGPEREILDSVISEINMTVAASNNLYLDLIKWETHAFPGIADDPQAVINEQIPSNYDIFIGILWARFGTPTRRALSGSCECI